MSEFDLQSESNFEKWYACYPKKQARANAEKVWARMHLDRLTTTIILKTKAFVEAYTAQGKLEYLPMPATFLNQRRWEDQLAVQKQEQPQAVEVKRDPRIRMFNGAVSARSSDTESVAENCKAFNRQMEVYGFEYRDWNF